MAKFGMSFSVVVLIPISIEDAKQMIPRFSAVHSKRRAGDLDLKRILLDLTVKEAAAALGFDAKTFQALLNGKMTFAADGSWEQASNVLEEAAGRKRGEGLASQRAHTRVSYKFGAYHHVITEQNRWGLESPPTSVNVVLTRT
jgi:hypothetical protein